MFSVPPDIKYLDSEQLEALTESFRAWYRKASRVDIHRARGRVWLVYLLLRYTGARLGEVLALDDRTDIDFERSVVKFWPDESRLGQPLREVQLPDFVIAEISAYLDAAAEMRGAVFQLDQGYVRRKFYERAKAIAFPQELGNPRVLRHSRAIELLRSGAPLPVVQNILGHGSINLTAHYCDFSEEDLKRLVQYYMQKEMRLKTSARNSFTGKVTQISTGKILSEVKLITPSGHKLVSVITNESLHNLGLAEGSIVTAIVKAPWIIIESDADSTKTSARNRLRGTVTKINAGQIVAEVIASLEDGTGMVTLITVPSLENLNLKVGDKAWFLFKAFSVILNVD
ncbi:MAG: TOBE domain-containing protein [Syntrophobacterales bacterium]|nr:TOBE domain-containing protein [Syntrophobacterales bacterium]